MNSAVSLVTADMEMVLKGLAYVINTNTTTGHGLVTDDT
jgi:hypothetical protein